jgi:enoyl-CoA hydratase
VSSTKTKSPIPAETVRVDKAGPVTTVILDRAAVRNAVDNATAEALARAFRDFEADAEAKVGVFWGDHGTFCAGADLKAVASGERAERYQNGAAVAGARLQGDGPMGPSRLVLSKPVIAAVSGYAVAGGMELALWCDLRVMEEDAVFGVYCRRWGVPLIDGGTVRLPRLIGLGRALDLILTGRPVEADEALAMGLANRVVPKGQARARAEELAQELARFPQLCLRTDRASAYRSFDLDFQEAMLREFSTGVEVIEKEARAGARRFVEGRGRGGRFDDL